MIRVLHITGKLNRGGIEIMLMNLYRHIDRAKFQFDFVSFSDEEGAFDKEIIDMGGKIYSIVESNPIKRMFALKKLLKKHPEYKIIHCHTLFSNAFHIYAGKMAKLPFRIAHSHGTRDNSKGKLIGLLYQNISRKIINNYSTHFISCGEAAGSFLFPSQKDVLFLPNSIDTECFSKIGETERNYLKDEFQLNDDYFKIIQVGKIDAVKNHNFSLQIAAELKNRNIKFKMFFAGQGVLFEEIENKIKDKELTEDVILLGVRSDIPQLMAGSDVMLMPSFHEGFPVVLVEAQSVGIPSLIADTISSEVDLGVGLVEFESLDSDISKWANKLIEIKNKKKIDVQERLNKLSEQGFDMKSSVLVLSDLYNSMK